MEIVFSILFKRKYANDLFENVNCRNNVFVFIWNGTKPEASMNMQIFQDIKWRTIRVYLKLLFQGIRQNYEYKSMMLTLWHIRTSNLIFFLSKVCDTKWKNTQISFCQTWAEAFDAFLQPKVSWGNCLTFYDWFKMELLSFLLCNVTLGEAVLCAHWWDLFHVNLLTEKKT